MCCADSVEARKIFKITNKCLIYSSFYKFTEGRNGFCIRLLFSVVRGQLLCYSLKQKRKGCSVRVYYFPVGLKAKRVCFDLLHVWKHFPLRLKCIQKNTNNVFKIITTPFTWRKLTKRHQLVLRQLRLLHGAPFCYRRGFTLSKWTLGHTLRSQVGLQRPTACGVRALTWTARRARCQTCWCPRWKCVHSTQSWSVYCVGWVSWIGWSVDCVGWVSWSVYCVGWVSWSVYYLAEH